MWFFRRKGPSGFSASSTAEEVTYGIDGTGLTSIVTDVKNAPKFPTITAASSMPQPPAGENQRVGRLGAAPACRPDPEKRELWCPVPNVAAAAQLADTEPPALQRAPQPCRQSSHVTNS